MAIATVPKRHSISRRYFVSMALVVMASMLLLAGIFLTLAGRYLRSENSRNLNVAAERIGQVLDTVGAAGLDEAGYHRLAEHAAALVSEVADASLVLTDETGRVLYASDGLPVAAAVLPQNLLTQLRAGRQTQGVTDLDGFLQRRYYVAGTRCAGAQGDGFLLVLSDAGRFRGYLSELVFSFLWASALMLLISGMLALVTTKYVSAPLTQISKAADRFGKGDFTARVTVEKGGNGEIAQLAQNFNAMAANLEAIDRSQRSFMGDIAHELRTPMTSIKGFIDGMLDGVIPPEQYPKYLGLASDEAARLTRLIQSMLDITRVEAGEYTVNAKSYDIWQTLGAVLMSNEQRLVEGRIGVGGYAPQRTMVYADSDLVYQVVYNIVDNAIKFTPPGGRIDLDVGTSGERVYVRIANTGSGVPAEQLPHLFDRFYKGDKSRGLNAGGAGLGMHISKVLIGISGGSIRVDSDSASWTAFTFELPAGRPELPPARRKRSGLMRFRLRTRA